jgi:hypothetical protein
MRDVNSGVVRSVKRGTGRVGITRTSFKFESRVVRLRFRAKGMIAHVLVRLA